MAHSVLHISFSRKRVFKIFFRCIKAKKSFEWTEGIRDHLSNWYGAKGASTGIKPVTSPTLSESLKQNARALAIQPGLCLGYNSLIFVLLHAMS